jgi:hypothetical protein
MIRADAFMPAYPAIKRQSSMGAAGKNEVQEHEAIKNGKRAAVYDGCKSPRGVRPEIRHRHLPAYRVKRPIVTRAPAVISITPAIPINDSSWMFANIGFGAGMPNHFSNPCCIIISPRRSA